MTHDTVNFPSRCLFELLEAHGIVNVIASPGSRNAPLLVAATHRPDIKMNMVTDERVAAFMALGLANTIMKPVTLICTSGTALLNYSPAVAEAYYRKVPLIIVSADRPIQWIDQDDSQTLHQHKALSNYVKQSYDIPAIRDSETDWMTNRLINDAILTANTYPKGPIHINIQISEPIGKLTYEPIPKQRLINVVSPRSVFPVNEIRALGKRLASPRKIMIIAGFMQPDATLDKAIKRISRLPNFAIFTETLSNLHGEHLISDIDATLSVLTQEKMKQLAPDVVITLGGALVSRHIKNYIRQHTVREHWHIGATHTTVDCFKQLTLKIPTEPALFFQQLASAMQPHQEASYYRKLWLEVRDSARALHHSFVAKAPWCDLKAFSTLMPMIPREWNLQLSNGTPVRYAQLFTIHHTHRSDCNRGVSGIDGCTSTAIGAALGYARPTLLISGDTSAQYDVGALGSGQLSPRFKMIVICNGGGGIFKFISSTRHLDIVEDCYCKPTYFPAEALAKAYGMEYYEATDVESLRYSFKSFATHSSRPTLLAIHTDSDLSAKILTEYFSLKLSEDHANLGNN